jgi:hypothetical protein
MSLKPRYSRRTELVSTAIKKLADAFGRGRNSLETQWDRDGDVSSGDLRIALQKCRTFFRRLLPVYAGLAWS